MTDELPLLIVEGLPPTTAHGDVGVVMAHSSGHNKECQWFDYRASFLGSITRIEWELGTMHTLLPAGEAEILFARNYARPMTTSEAQDYNGQIQDVVEPEPPPRAAEEGE